MTDRKPDFFNITVEELTGPNRKADAVVSADFTYLDNQGGDVQDMVYGKERCCSCCRP